MGFGGFGFVSWFCVWFSWFGGGFRGFVVVSFVGWCGVALFTFGGFRSMMAGFEVVWAVCLAGFGWI